MSENIRGGHDGPWAEDNEDWSAPAPTTDPQALEMAKRFIASQARKMGVSDEPNYGPPSGASERLVFMYQAAYAASNTIGENDSEASFHAGLQLGLRLALRYPAQAQDLWDEDQAHSQDKDRPPLAGQDDEGSSIGALDQLIDHFISLSSEPGSGISEDEGDDEDRPFGPAINFLD